MLEVGADVARASLVVGLVVTAFLYTRTRVASGGAVTGSYLAFLILSGNWADVVAWFLLALIGLAATRALTNRFPLSRTWAYYIGVLVPATIHVVLVSLAQLPPLSGFSALLVAGLYVTNGLTAYDMNRQGVARTSVAIVAVTAVTLAIMVPLALVMHELAPRGQSVPYFTAHEPLLILLCIVLSAGVHLGLGWGTAGIIGSLFLIEILTWQSILILVALSAGGAVIARRATRLLALSPRQRLYSILVVGSIVSWFGLYWLDWLGLPGAQFHTVFGVETLLVIGLLISENVRLGAARTYGGAAIVTSGTAVASWSMSQHATVQLAVGVALLVVITALFWWGLRSQQDLWRRAVLAGDRWAVLGDTDRRRFLRGGLFATDATAVRTPARRFDPRLGSGSAP